MSSALRCLQRLEIGARAGGLLQVSYEASALHATLCARDNTIAIISNTSNNNNNNNNNNSNNHNNHHHHDEDQGKSSIRVVNNITTNDGNAGLAHQLRLLTLARRQHYPNVEKRICKAAIQ